MKAEALASLAGGMWEHWQEKVVRPALPNFAANPIYVEQKSQPEEEFRAIAEQVKFMGPFNEEAKDRDAQFGGRLVDTCLGPVTRMWLDSNIETHFLYRHLPTLETARVLDIGSGYGRFAVAIEEHVGSVTCVDAVPISTQVCRQYTEQFGAAIEVLPVKEFIATYPSRQFDLAVNIHSWNECTLEQVENWLAVLVEMKVPYLFTVSHGQLDSKIERAYYTWQLGLPSYRPAIERYFDLVAEESIGLTNHPHALWKLKTGAVPVEYVPPEKPLVWIATPLRNLEARGLITQDDFGKLAEHYREPIRALSLTETLPWRFELCLVGGGGVARARNVIVRDFLASKAEYLFFVDYDLMPTPNDYVSVMAKMHAHGLQVCGGLYTIRDENGHWVYNGPDVEGIREGWALRVMELGTGFKCYHRSALLTIANKNPWLLYENDDTHKEEWGFFSMGPVRDEKFWPGKSRWLTEDYWLDWLTRDAGIPIVVDVTVKLKHLEETTGEIYPKEFPPLPVKVVPVETG